MALLTRSGMRSQIRQLINDQNSIRFTDGNLNTFLDIANADAIARLGPFDVSEQTDTLTGSDTFASSQANYTLNDTTIGIRELYLENEQNRKRRIDIITEDEMARRYGSTWADNDTSNLGEPQVAFRKDHNVFGVFPSPNAANHGKTWTAVYYRMPSAFASDSATPIFLDALNIALVWHSLSACHWQLGDREGSELALKRYNDLISRFYSAATVFSDELRGFRWDVS